MKTIQILILIELYFIALLVIKIVNYKTQNQYLQVICGVMTPLILIPTHKYLKSSLQRSPQTLESIQLFLRSFCTTLLSQEDELLKNNIQPAFRAFQNILIGLMMYKYCLPPKNQVYKSQLKVFTRCVLALQVLVLINVTQFLNKNTTIEGSITLPLLCTILFFIILEHNYRSYIGENIFNLELNPLRQLQVVESINQSLHQFALQSRRHMGDSSQKSNQQVQDMLDQQKNFFKVLFNQLPYGLNFDLFLGMLILSENNDIQYNNTFLTNLMSCSSEQDALEKILNLRNCSYQFKEQAEFNELFKALDIKSKNSMSRKGIKEGQEQTPNFDVEMFQSESLNVRTEFENIKTISRDRFQRAKSKTVTHKSFSNKEQNTEKFLFTCEVKMICVVESSHENLQESTSCIQPSQLFEVILRPYLYDNKLFVLFLVRDVTMFNEFSVLQKVNENKSQMLYQVAHEFRTPLNCIILLTENLADQFGPQNELTQDYLLPISTSANQLLSFVNDLLDLAQLNAGKFKLTNQNFDLIDLLVNILNIMNIQAKAKNLYLKMIIDPQDMNSEIVSDPKRIQQVIMNLISNSIKFTQKGGITLEVKRQENLLNVNLIDSGIGIEMEDQNKLFKAFGKLENSSSINVSGVGLGLMISNILSKKLSNDENVGITVISEGKDKGAQFQFKIYDHYNKQQNFPDYLLQSNENNSLFIQKSLRQSQQVQQLYEGGKCIYTFSNSSNINVNFSTINQNGQKRHSSNMVGIGVETEQLLDSHHASDQQEEIEPYNFSQCKCIEILIVDDEIFNLIAFTRAVQKYKLKIESANGSLECLNKVSQYTQDPKCTFNCRGYRVILMDIEMPEKNGLETSQIIRKIETNKKSLSSYIIAYSGHQGPQIRDQCIRAGMNELQCKPIKPKNFVNIIERLIEKSQQLIVHDIEFIQ